MPKLRWKRIEPGYYRTACGRYEIANMKGQSVAWSGLILCTWEVRYNTDSKPKFTSSYGSYKTGETVRTMVEAKALAQKWADQEVKVGG